MVDLGYVLRRAWEIFRGEHALWAFGFLASLGATGVWLSTGGGRVGTSLAAGPYRDIMLAVLALLAAGISLGLALMNAAGQAALVDQVKEAEERGCAVFTKGWEAGKRYLWPVFLLRLVLGLPVAVVIGTGLLPLAIWVWAVQTGSHSFQAGLAGLLLMPLGLLACLGPAMLLALALGVPLNVLMKLAIRATVLHGYGWRRSVSHAWVMMRQYSGTVVVLWLIQLGVTMGGFVLLGLPVALLALALLAAVTTVGLFSALLFLTLAITAGVGIWVVTALVGGLVGTYVSAVWTVAYRELFGLGLTGVQAAVA